MLNDTSHANSPTQLGFAGYAEDAMLGNLCDPFLASKLGT